MRKLTLFLYLLFSSFLATHAVAINLSDGGIGNYAFLAQSALGKCAERDGRVFTSTLLRALDHSSDGSTVEWRNTQTGSHGRIEVLKDPDGTPDCRLARIATDDKTVKGQELYQFCKKNGKWLAHAR
jgi:surface antigen